jgi:hypothetical protein
MGHRHNAASFVVGMGLSYRGELYGLVLCYHWVAMRNYPALYPAPMLNPSSVQALLRDPSVHWKKGRSAYEAAHTWVASQLNEPNGWPKEVDALLQTAPEWAGARLVTGFFEHATPLDTDRGPTNTDLLILARATSALGVIAVEAKAGEPFGDKVEQWNTTAGRADRLRWACDVLGMDPTRCGPLRWQLFHRTAAAILEAQRFCAPQAMMLVHDFAPEPCWVEDYKAFAEVAGFVGAEVGAASEAKSVGGVIMRLGWAQGDLTK